MQTCSVCSLCWLCSGEESLDPPAQGWQCCGAWGIPQAGRDKNSSFSEPQCNVLHPDWGNPKHKPRLGREWIKEVLSRT